LEVEMSDVLVLHDSFAGGADVLPPASVCSWRDCGLDTASLHVAGELDVTTTPQLERTLEQAQPLARLSGSIDVVIHDLDPGEPPAHVLLRLAGEELAS
jgi:hypothetical protein